MNYTSIQKIKSRLLNLIDQVLVQFDHAADMGYGIDQSLLEEFCQLVRRIVVEREVKVDVEGKVGGKKGTNRKIKLPRPYGLAIQNSNQPKSNELQFQPTLLLQILTSQTLTIHTLTSPSPNSPHSPTHSPTSPTTYTFPSDTLKKFSSITQVTPTKFIIAGGCYFSNPALKTANIWAFDVGGGGLSKIGEMVQAVSSHGCVYIQPRVYFVGGKKEEGVITRMCSYFDIHKRQSVQIAALNYPAASLLTLPYKTTKIYKIGGLGQSFHHFNISPYIQRYTISQNKWQVINPYINPNSLTNFTEFQLYAHSVGYVGQKGEIVVFGGFGFEKVGVGFGWVMDVGNGKGKGEAGGEEGEGEGEGEGGDQEEDLHQIVEFGDVDGLEPGGFWSSQIIKVNGSIKSKSNKGSTLIMLQTTTTPKLSTKIITLETK